MNVSDLVAALKKVIPLLRFMAKWTPTTVDDQAVDWLEKFLDNQQAVDAATAHIAP